MTAAASGIGGALASRAACDVIEGFPNISPNMEEENEQQTQRQRDTATALSYIVPEQKCGTWGSRGCLL